LLLWKGIRRALREPYRRGGIILVVALAVVLWSVATYFIGLVTFATAWGLAHTEAVPDGMFPEGWAIYGWLGAYTLCGAALHVALGKVPRR
jgi:hypothetical protein